MMYIPEVLEDVLSAVLKEDADSKSYIDIRGCRQRDPAGRRGRRVWTIYQAEFEEAGKKHVVRREAGPEH